MYYGVEVIGVPFSEAQANLAYVAQLARDSIVMTHSAGMSLLEDMTPREVIAIAPSMPTNMPLMAWRTLAKSVALYTSGRLSQERLRKVQEYHARTMREHMIRPYYNVGQAGKICRFDPALLAVKLVNRGVPVTLGFMSHDVFFPKSSRHAHIETARQRGVVIQENIPGHHDELLLYPLTVLAQVAQLQ
jgi:hypothetical protein